MITTLLALIGVFVLAVTHGITSRMCGGGSWSLPFGLDQWFHAIPYGILSFLMLLPVTSGLTLWGLAAFGYLGAVLGKRLGHGQWMDLGHFFGITTAEKMDFIIEWFFGEDKNISTVGQGSYWRDFAGLTLSGILIGITTVSVALYCQLYALAGALLIGSAFKSVAYAIGWWIESLASQVGFLTSPEDYDEPTEVGEFLTGFFAGLPVWGGIIWLALMLLP